MNRKYGFLIIGIFLLILPLAGIYAQNNDQNYTRTFRQRGSATRTMRSNELVGAHATLPLGTKVLVTNLQNDRHITITITGRIAAAGNRIIDLSQVAAIALRMGDDDSVSVSIEVVRGKETQEAEQ
ncbi:MAG: septal ring lytic transglycosylase RlpA family protein [Treponema sp.]|jgi:rare lipoprotein A|nr:septal ring lytic transglycosylase RlpA family protein [Treponema sp.]